jgi:EAL domain-containing protein (putative c-di-GMP-specific phosphodiesterase class I)/putative methionine-R-sulfoxide reductase with GAF domain
VEAAMSQRELAIAVGEAVDPTALMQRVCDRTLELIGAADGVAIGLLADHTITYVCGAGAGMSSVGTSVGLHDSLSGLAVRTGEILRSGDTRRDLRVDSGACHALSVVSLVCIPLTRSHQVYGVMAVNAALVDAFTDEHVDVLTRLADFVSVAVGSAWDLHRATHELVQIGQRAFHAHDADPSDETSRRYVMNVLDPDTVKRLDARRRIRGVLDDPSQLSIVFQPVVDLLSGEVVAVEALARFNVVPVQPPNVWFDDARFAGLGVELEMLAVRRALELQPMLPDGITITINVGPETIVGPHLQQALRNAIPRGVVIELTEHLSFDDYPGLQAALFALRRQGIRVAVDDAGSGYSSLTHILQLAPDYIKLDREMIRSIDIDPVRRALVTSLVSFAGDTGASIVAEGLETIDELDAVRRLGVRYAQGYYLGRPLPIDAIDLDSPASSVVQAAVATCE